MSIIHPNKEQLLWLRDHLSGRPFQLIDHFDNVDENYLVALRISKDEYCDKEAIREAILEKVVWTSAKLPSECEQLKEHISLIQYEPGKQDRYLGYDFLQEYSGRGWIVAYILFRKLPSDIQMELMKAVSTPYPSLNCMFISNSVKVRSRTKPGSQRYKVKVTPQNNSQGPSRFDRPSLI